MERLSHLICCILTCGEFVRDFAWTYHMYFDKQALRIRKFLYVHNSRTFTLLYFILFACVYLDHLS